MIHIITLAILFIAIILCMFSRASTLPIITLGGIVATTILFAVLNMELAMLIFAYGLLIWSIIVASCNADNKMVVAIAELTFLVSLVLQGAIVILYLKKHCVL